MSNTDLNRIEQIKKLIEQADRESTKAHKIIDAYLDNVMKKFNALDAIDHMANDKEYNDELSKMIKLDYKLRDLYESYDYLYRRDFESNYKNSSLDWKLNKIMELEKEAKYLATKRGGIYEDRLQSVSEMINSLKDVTDRNEVKFEARSPKLQ